MSETVRLSESTSEEELIQVIEQYNNDDRFHGILVQLPLPAHINDKRVILAIDPKKMWMVFTLSTQDIFGMDVLSWCHVHQLESWNY